MYYRVAIQVDAPPSWRWKSSVLSSLHALFQWFRLFRALPQDHLRVFSSSSREGLAEQFEQESKGLESHSVTAAQFLSERLIRLPMVRGTSEQEGETSREMVSLAMTSQPRVNERSGGGSALERRGMSAQDRRREELESGSGGDQDLPYRFSLPISLPQVLAWITLRERVQQGELHP
ncbi:MAG TPA: hypothetical protein VF043_14750 [Ktedonobacteraceae bacterium]